MISDRVCCLPALPIVFVAMIRGLLMLSVHPIGAVLILLSVMSLSLRVAGGVCGEHRISPPTGRNIASAKAPERGNVDRRWAGYEQ